MKFSREEYETIEDLAACHYGPREIAIYLEVPTEAFYNAWNREEDRYIEGTIRYHYERGLLVARAEMEMKILESAKAGNVTSIQQWKKAQSEQDFINALQV